MAQVTLAQVVAEARNHIVDRARSLGYVEADYSFICTVGKPLGIEYDAGNRAGGRDFERFSGQVRRALDKLAEDGSVVRVGVKERAPDGVRPRWTRYYVPGEYHRIAAEHAEKKARHEQTRARWDLTVERLGRVLGNPVKVDHLGRPILDPDQWDEILESLVTF